MTCCPHPLEDHGDRAVLACAGGTVAWNPVMSEQDFYTEWYRFSSTSKKTWQDACPCPGWSAA